MAGVAAAKMLYFLRGARVPHASRSGRSRRRVAEPTTEDSARPCLPPDAGPQLPARARVLLPPEGASFCEPCKPVGSQRTVERPTHKTFRLCMAKDHVFIMEFPDLGKHCSERTCKQLDFLPITCDACKQDFCKDHFSYVAHKCPFAFKKDVQVPVCPLCNIPVPVKRGENTDVVVGEHMDRDCTSHPGRKREKVFTHRCSKEGCRKKEMLQLACVQCHSNFCIQHRHPLDHGCQPRSSSASRAGPSATRVPEPKLLGALNTLSSSWLAQRFRWKVK